MLTLSVCFSVQCGRPKISFKGNVRGNVKVNVNAVQSYLNGFVF